MIERNKKKLLKKIIEISYNLLIQKLANGGVITKNEAAFELGHILKTIGQLYEFSSDDKFHLEFETDIKLAEKSSKSGTQKARVDILVKYTDKDIKSDVSAAIELKYLKKANHREPNNRYDVFADIENLEKYKCSGVNLCYFILWTDHSHYFSDKEALSTDTKDFDFRHGSKYIAGTQLSYNTPKGYKGPLTLSQNYNFEWENVKDFHFLKVLV